MVDAVAGVFLEKLVGALSEGGRIVNEYRGQFETLQTELLLMQSLLKDAERLKRKNLTLRRVMADLRETIYQAEDLLADCQFKSGDPVSSKRFKPLSILKIPFHLRAGKRLEEMLAKIAAIKKNIRTFLGLPILAQPDRPGDQMAPRWSSEVYDHALVVGLEADTRKLKGWLVEAGKEGITAVAVVGMGGLGKTTVAQTVFAGRDVEERFERRMWVSVTQTFTEEQVLRSMLRSLGDASSGDGAGELLRKVNQCLTGKRFLLVMDDVWDCGDAAWWDRIREGLPSGNGSCVVITTRFLKVAKRMGVRDERVHRPKCLSSDNSWLLFRKIAFAGSDGECRYSGLEAVGKEIVEKCKGLPLAIRAVAGVILCKPQVQAEWRRIADHFADELADNDSSVMASLQLSYDELPSYLKPCFLCLSLYPEDCVVSKDQLVRWWIGEGFVPLRRGGRSATEAAEDCFAGLTNRCLLEIVDRSYHGGVDTCKAHDMVRDLVVRIARENAFCTQDANDDLRSCRRLCLDAPLARGRLPAGPKLRALVSAPRTGEVNKVPPCVAENLCGSKYLRAVDLSRSVFGAPVSMLLGRIGALRHLTYVSLSNTHLLVHLPPSLEKLRGLQILDLSYCQNLRSLPGFITSLKSLRVLDVSHCGSLEFLPKGLGRLSALEILLGFKPARPSQPEGCRIGEIKNLAKVRRLGLELSCGDEISDSELSTLASLQELQQLCISCYNTHEDGDVGERIDALCVPPQLQELSLKFFPGRVSSRWLSPDSLPVLRWLSVCSGNLVKMSDGFWSGGEWGVEALQLESLSEFEEEWERVSSVMPSLRVVSASWCPELVSFPIEDIGFRGGVWKKDDHPN